MIQSSIQVDSSGRTLLTEGEVKSVVTRRLKAAANEQAEAHRSASIALGRAEAKNWTGRWARGLVILPPTRIAEGFVCELRATAPHSSVLETGHGGFVSAVRVRRGMRIKAGVHRQRASVGAMRPRDWFERGRNLSAAERAVIADKWGAAIAETLRTRAATGRVGR